MIAPDSSVTIAAAAPWHVAHTATVSERRNGSRTAGARQASPESRLQHYAAGRWIAASGAIATSGNSSSAPQRMQTAS